MNVIQGTARLVQIISDGLSMVRIRGESPNTQGISAAHTICDLRRLASRRLPAPIFDYIDGGAGSESALARNERAFADLQTVPRVLRDVSQVDTSSEFLGRRLALPVVLAPVGLVRTAHHEGELGVTAAAERLGIPMAVSTMSSTSIEAIAEHAPKTNRWFQLYLWRDRAASKAILDRAAAAGYGTLMLTVDVPVAGERQRDLRHGLRFPPSVPLVTALRCAMRPRWTWHSLSHGPIRFAALDLESDDFAAQTNRILDPSMTFRELEWLREVWDGSIVVKGILSPHDAVAVRDAGADGIVVSNHGGRQMENAIATAHALPRVRSAVGQNFPLIVDGGIRSGTHVAAALALGADAAMIGRPYLYGLAAGGQAGVERAVEILKSGLERAMALLGAATVAELKREMVFDPANPWEQPTLQPVMGLG